MDAETRSHAVWIAALRRELRALVGRWSQMPGLCGVPEWRTTESERMLDACCAWIDEANRQAEERYAAACERDARAMMFDLD